MSRWKAAGIHLGISLVVAALVAGVIYFIWYPPPYFTVSGGSTLMLLIMGVDVVIGPFLTLWVYRQGKKGLKFDLFVIAVLQLAAFYYGLHIIANARPVFIVAALDRFVPVYANELSNEDLSGAKQPEFSKRSWAGPVLVGAVLPEDAKERSNLAFSGAAGKDIDKFPKYYESYAKVADAIRAKAKPLAELAAKSATNQALIEAYLAHSALPIDRLAYLPLHGRQEEYAMVLSSDSGQPLGALPIDPW